MTPFSRLRQDLTAIVRAAVDAADAGRLLRQALSCPDIVQRLRAAAAVDVLAVGKAAAPMIEAVAAATPVALRGIVGVGPAAAPGPRGGLAPGTLDIEWHSAGHPVPNDESVIAARRAAGRVRSVGPDDLVLVLLSGGASSLLALPAADLTLEDKQTTVRALLAAGADISELNTVRKHLSAIKGGQLASLCVGSMLTLAVSDVVGDSLTLIGSGPTVGDPSTWQMALGVLDGRGGRSAYPRRVTRLLERGAAGEVPDTPKPGDARLSRSVARVIGGARAALDGAAAAAVSLGYDVHILAEPVVGEARLVGQAHAARIARAASAAGRPACMLSAGETTVRVVGGGRGGRNQEFVLAMVGLTEAIGRRVVAASVGTDGVDGPTDAAGAVIDPTTAARAAAAGLAPPAQYLDNNDSYTFFRALGDLMFLRATNTNVGDLQVVLVEE